jgi:hypothetical protein
MPPRCKVCLRPMLNEDGTGTSCLSEMPDWPRVDKWGPSAGVDLAGVALQVDRNCPDCNCPVGAFHHANCDMERCQHGNQAISCSDCWLLYR